METCDVLFFSGLVLVIASLAAAASSASASTVAPLAYAYATGLFAMLAGLQLYLRNERGEQE